MRTENLPMHVIQRVTSMSGPPGQWDAPAWRDAPIARIDHFHPRGSDHRPRTEARLLHDGQTIYALFTVADRFVRCVHTAYDSDTHKDSCVELFLQPVEREGYFALEVNCGGAFSLRYIEDPTRTANRFAKWVAVSAEDAARIRVAHSMPAIVEPERVEPTTWWVEVAWPTAVMEPYCGSIGTLSSQRWRGNLFKCADATSHPHWAAWAPIGEALNFHQPRYFGEMAFA
jgi:hypothetical protein